MPLPTSVDRSFTNAGGLRIFAQSWTPPNVRAVIVLVHGYGEHHQRYTHWIERLYADGYAVYALDHQGHGRSEGLRAYVPQFFDFTDDVHRLRQQAAADQPAAPLFLYGHSMGALITLCYLLRYGHGLTGAITSGAPVLPEANVSPLLVKVGQLLDKLAPKLELLEPAPLSSLSRDQRVIDAFEADPLNYHGKLRVHMGIEISRAARYVRDHFAGLTYPILMLHGTADPFVAVAGTELAYAQAPSTDKTLKLYQGLYHEIHNEPEQETVFADMLAWLKAHLPTAG